MAKNSFPMPKTGVGIIPKIIGLLLLLGVGALIVQHPVDAAHWVSNAFSWCGGIVNALASFLRTAAG